MWFPEELKSLDAETKPVVVSWEWSVNRLQMGTGELFGGNGNIFLVKLTCDGCTAELIY